MTPRAQQSSLRWRLIAVAALLVVNIISSWYPFVFDLPERVTNTAKRQTDGTWNLDNNSRVTASVPESAAAVMATSRFRLTVEARPALPNQTGPARLFAIGGSPYETSFMIGIDRDEIVLRLPCGAAAAGIDAEWRMAIPDWRKVAVSAWLEPSADGLMPILQVGTAPQAQLQNNCPKGTAPRLPDAGAPWTLGNVRTGHRPFEGRIVKLELDGAGQHIDLLRSSRWHVPARFWMWPERVNQPDNNDILATIWHFVGYVPLGYFAGMAIPHLGYARVLTGALVFSATLNGGKLLVAGRHASLVDLLVNLAGLLAGLAAYRRRETRSATRFKPLSGETPPPL
jgi:VanZ family protein